MIPMLRAAVFEAINKEESLHLLYHQLSLESKDPMLKDFFKALSEDVLQDVHILKNLNLHSIAKFGFSIRFQASKCVIDEKLAMSIKDKKEAMEALKLCTDQINADIEYYEHMAQHSLFNEVKKMFLVLSDKQLEHKCKLKALEDLLV